MQSEVTCINKQKFLIELSKLLTFMYEDDRAEAVSMYEDMFDKAADERALCEHLVSPTRQAVIIARAYNSNPRKLSVYCETRTGNESRDDGIPGYVQVINNVFSEACKKDIFTAEEPVDENQFTFFDEVEEVPAAEVEDVPAEDEPSLSLPVQTEEFPEAPAEDTAEEAAAEPAEEPAEEPAAEPAEEHEDTPSEESSPEEESADEVDEFMKDFSIVPEGEAKPAPILEAAPAEDEYEYEEDELSGETERRAKIFPLILYIIAAIPLTVAGIALLLVPAIVCLALAVVAMVAGVMIFSAAFGGFSVFADIMAVVGGAIILLAVGILALWLFIWFIGGAVAGLVRGVFALGGKWCFKEVQV